MESPDYSARPLSRSNTNPPVNWIQQSIAGWLVQLRPEFVASSIKKFLLPHRVDITANDGVFNVDIASCLGHQLLCNGIYESGMVQVLKTFLNSGNTIVDLGANEGYFSVIASQKVGKTGKVIAIEPQSRLQPIIRQNLSLNDCENVKVLQVAVSDKPENVTLYISTDMNTGSTSVIETSRFSLPKEEIPALTLSEVFNQEQITTCDLLKVDIEGYEYEAIMGSQDLFKSHRVKAIALELHPQHLAKRGLSDKEIVDFLKCCGYSLSPMCSNTVFVSPNCQVQEVANE